MSAPGWFYDYNVGDPYVALGCPAEPARFSPMNWCLSAMPDPVPSYVNQTYMMGFNEPNLAQECGKTPEEVAKAWGTFMKLHPHSRLVSPATAGYGVPWFDNFFGNCTKLYGKEGCRISYIAAHDYSCTPAHTLAYLKELHERYGLPVWLTEFSCGDGAQNRPNADQLAFMKVVVPMLDAAPFVYRYAWMSARGDPARSLLETVNGEARLTDVGKLYNSL